MEGVQDGEHAGRKTPTVVDPEVAGASTVSQLTFRNLTVGGAATQCPPQAGSAQEGGVYSWSHEQEPQRASNTGAHAIFEAFFNTVQSPNATQIEALGILTLWSREEILVWFNQKRAGSRGDTFKFPTPTQLPHLLPDFKKPNEPIIIKSSENELQVDFASPSGRTKRESLSAKARERASLVRKVGACWRCRLLKMTCTLQEPCLRCQVALENTLWQTVIGCQRQKLETLSLSCFPPSTQPSITSFDIEHKFKNKIPRRFQLSQIGVTLSDNQWLDPNSSMRLYEFSGFSDLHTSEIYECLNDKPLSLAEMSQQAAFNLTKIMVMQFSVPETRTTLNCFSLLRNVARAEIEASKLPDLLKSAMMSVISLSHLSVRRHMLGKEATNEDLSAEIALCHITVKTFFCELEHPIMRRPIGDDDKLAQHWLNLFYAICVFSIAKSLLVDNLPWDENERETLHIPGRINGPDHVYNVAVTLFELSYRRCDLLFDNRHHNSRIGAEIQEICKMVQRDRWDEWRFKTSADFLYGLGAGRVELVDGSTFCGFFPQIEPPSEPLLSKPTNRKKFDHVSGPSNKESLRDSFTLFSAFPLPDKTTLQSLKSEYENSDSVFPVSGYTPSMADLSETSALTEKQENTLTLLAETAEPILERKRRRYDEEERRQVAERRKLGSCDECRAAKIKCLHNYRQPEDQSNEQMTGYLASDYSYERMALGLSSKPIGFSVQHEINETLRPLFDGSLDEFSSSNAISAGTAKPDSTALRCTFPGCNCKRFSRSADLKRHMDSIHNPKARVKCPIEDCPSGKEKLWATARLDKLRRHMQSVHGISSEKAQELIASQRQSAS